MENWGELSLGLNTVKLISPTLSRMLFRPTLTSNTCDVAQDAESATVQKSHAVRAGRQRCTERMEGSEVECGPLAGYLGGR